LYLEVYPDIVFILNFFVDFILLFLLKQVSRKSSTTVRLFGSAAIGGLAAAILSVFPWINSYINLGYLTILMDCLEAVIKFLTLLIIIFVAFGRLKRKDYIRQVIAFILITYFAGGFINSVYYHTNIRLILLPVRNSIVFSNISAKYVITLMLCLIPAAAAYMLLQRIYKHNFREIYEVELYYKEKKYKTSALYDTGNCLYDPVYRKPVIVIEQSALAFLLTVEEQNAIATIMDCVDQSSIPEELRPRLQFIPYSSIGKIHGMMPGLLLDMIIIHIGKETICCDKVIAAISDQRQSPKGEYHVILHKELV